MIPKKPFNTRVWNYLSSTLQEFKVMLLGYRSYTALLSQSGTNAPTALVLENTIGDIVWSRDSDGVYKGTLAAAFVENKTAFFNSLGSSTNIKQIVYRNDSNTFFFEQVNELNIYVDGLYGESIEIRVYN